MALLKEQPPPKILKTSTIETSNKSLLVPTEIIFEILLRLPVESLLRCKSVCKVWFCLISDPHFVKSHLKRSTSTSSNDYDYSRHQLFWISGPIFSLKTCPLNDVLFARSVVVGSLDHGYAVGQRPYNGSLHIIGSCNGLLCIIVDKVTLFICNPSTRIWNRLPSYFDFKNPKAVYSFGYDNLTDDYKVVVISWVWKTRAEPKLFSLKSATWKNIDGIPEGIELICYNGKFSNGAIHWEARDSISSCDFAILSFDLAMETYGQVSPPPPVYDDGNDKQLKLGVLGESLCVICNYRGDRDDVWVMKVYGVKDSWTKLVSIPYLNNPNPYWWTHFSVLVSIDGNFLLQSGQALVVYDSKNRSSSKIQNFDDCRQACTFVESLVSPNAVAASAAMLANNNVDGSCK